MTEERTTPLRERMIEDMRLNTGEFTRRSLIHVLPDRFHRSRSRPQIFHAATYQPKTLPLTAITAI